MTERVYLIHVQEQRTMSGMTSGMTSSPPAAMPSRRPAMAGPCRGAELMQLP